MKILKAIGYGFATIAGFTMSDSFYFGSFAGFMSILILFICYKVEGNQ